MTEGWGETECEEEWASSVKLGRDQMSVDDSTKAGSRTSECPAGEP